MNKCKFYVSPEIGEVILGYEGILASSLGEAGVLEDLDIIEEKW